MENYNEMTALSVITLMPNTKPQQQEFVRQVVGQILDGNVDPLKVDVYLKSIEDTIAAIRKNDEVKRLVLNESDKYGSKTFEAYGGKITVSQRSNKNYAACGDEVWDGLQQQMEQLKAAIKAREAALDAGVDPATGEALKKPVCTITPFLKIEFK